MSWCYKMVLLTALVSVASGCGDAVVPTHDKAPNADSHTEMLASLEQIKTARIYEQLFYGTKTIEDDEADLEFIPDVFSEQRFDQLHRLGQRHMWLGNTPRAIEHFEAAHQLVMKRKLDHEHWVKATFQLGLAYLRIGENENCVNCANGESCILPIRNLGVHEKQDGSKMAVKHFELLLEKEPDHVAARWLLNIAYMTLGQFPDRVPSEFLIAPDRFESTVEFPRFKNIATTCGLSTISLSGGAIVDDFDADGDLDVVTSSWDTNHQMRFFKNSDGQFTDATNEANLTGLYGGLNLIHADYDNDDDLDIYVMRGAWMGELGRMPNSLLQNDGNGHFRDVTFESGMSEHYPSQTAAWLDFDNDGDLDLYVGNEIYPCQLFRNDGEQFVDVAEDANVGNEEFVKGVTCGDFNNDRFPDIYVSNQGGNNRLYVNNRNGKFTDMAEELGVTGPNMSLPTWFWDYNQDGILDIFVGSYSDGQSYISQKYLDEPPSAELCRLYEGDGNGGFRDVAEERLLTHHTQTMGANFGDLDNDGFPDFYLGTGYPNYDGLMPNLMFWNRFGEAFSDVSAAGGFAHLQKGHAIAFADIDDDGDQDVFQEMGGAFPGDGAADCLYLNPGFKNSWIKIKLIGTRSNRSAIGARIKVDTTELENRRSIYKWVNCGGSFGENPLRQEIGLGAAVGIERIEIYWPTTDVTQEFHNVAVNQTIEIVEGATEFSVTSKLNQ